jgi:hypothetical protein
MHRVGSTSVVQNPQGKEGHRSLLGQFEMPGKEAAVLRLQERQD